MAYLFPYAGAERRTVLKNNSLRKVLNVAQPKKPDVPKGKVMVKFIEVSDDPLKAPPMMREIMRDVCEYHHIRVDELVRKNRSERLIIARRDFIVRAKRAGYSFTQIGTALGRDHSTCVYQFQSYLGGAEVDPVESIYSQVG